MAAALLVAACSSGNDAAQAPASTEPAPSTEPAVRSIGVDPWVPSTRSEELAAAMGTAGDVTLQDAVDAFGLVADEFPGTTPSNLPTGDTISASYALSLIVPLRDQLTGEQRAALDRYLSAAELIAEVADTGPASSDGSDPAGWRRAASPTAERYGDLLRAARDLWKQHRPSDPRPDQYRLKWFDKPGADGMATYETTEGGKVVCHVLIHTSFPDENPSDDKILFFFAHELFHCVQWRWRALRDVDTFGGFPLANPHPWAYEGGADWAAADLFRTRGIGYNDIRASWFDDPVEPLYARSYDAWPLFENARRDHLDVYAAIRAMVVAPLFDVAGTLDVGGLDGTIFRMTWSSRSLRRAPWGGDWDLDWVWKGREREPPLDNDVPTAGVDLGHFELHGVGMFGHPVYAVPVAGRVGLLTVAPSGAPLTTRGRAGTHTIADGDVGLLCFDPSGCECPEGQTSGAWAMEPGEMIASFAAADEAPLAALFAEEWDPERCRDEAPDQAESNGDPHLLTFDGLAYDVVALGEFVLARDPQGDFEVQTRHQPFGFGAGTTAFALSDGSARVTVTAPDFALSEAPTVRVDGVVEDRSAFDAGALRVTVDRDSESHEVTVTWPDGTRVEAQWFLGWFVTLTTAPGRAARMEGLLGSADGDLRNDLRGPDGGLVDSTDAEAYESPFALSWAVADATTLFDYAPGESVATFRVPHPRPEPPPPDPALEERCAAELGEQAVAHDVAACVYDVTATGDDGFVDRYAAVVERRAAGPDDLDPFDAESPSLTRPTPGTLEAGTPVEGRGGESVLRLAVGSSAAVRAAAGAVVVVRADEACPAGAFVDVVVVRAASPDDLARSALCDAQHLAAIGADDDDELVDGEAYVWIPGDGDYVVAVEGVLGPVEQLGEVDVFLDPSPLVIDAAQLADGAELRLEGPADAAALLPDPAVVYDVEGLMTACAIEIYTTDPFPHPDPRGLDVCGHTDVYDLPPTDQVVPLVVFARSGDPVDVRITPRR